MHREAHHIEVAAGGSNVRGGRGSREGLVRCTCCFEIHYASPVFFPLLFLSNKTHSPIHLAHKLSPFPLNAVGSSLVHGFSGSAGTYIGYAAHEKGSQGQDQTAQLRKSLMNQRRRNTLVLRVKNRIHFRSKPRRPKQHITAVVSTTTGHTYAALDGQVG